MAIKFLHKRRSARRVLLWMLIPTVLLQLVVNLVMDRDRPELRSPHLARVLANVRATPGANVVCLGTSRFGMGLSVAEIQTQLRAAGDPSLTVFNDSVPSGDFDTSDFVLRAMLRKGWRPALAVIEICPEMVNRRNRLLGAHVMPPLTRKSASTYLADLVLSRNLRRLFVERLIPVYRYRRSLWGEVSRGLAKISHKVRSSQSSTRRTALPSRPVSQDGSGEPSYGAAPAHAESAQAARPTAEELYLNGDPSMDPRRLTNENLPRVRTWLENYRIGGTSSLGLERLLRRCREHGMEVILVAPPVAGCQRALYTPAVENVFVPYMHQLEQAYQCRFVDCRDWVPDELFYDNHHLRPPGQSLFSRQLTRDVLVPRWSEKGSQDRAGRTSNGSSPSSKSTAGGLSPPAAEQ